MLVLVLEFSRISAASDLSTSNNQWTLQRGTRGPVGRRQRASRSPKTEDESPDYDAGTTRNERHTVCAGSLPRV